VNVSGKGIRTIDYDNLGREIKTIAPEGVVSKNWSMDGSQENSFTEKTTCKTYKNGEEYQSPCNVIHLTKKSTTISGLVAEEVNYGLDKNENGDSVKEIVSRKYNSMGQLTLNINSIDLASCDTGKTTTNTNSSYNSYGNLVDSTSDAPQCKASTGGFSAPSSPTNQYNAKYNVNGDITQEYRLDTSSSTLSKANFVYSLDSKGNRIGASGGYSGSAIKRYNAEGKVAQFYVMNVSNFCGMFSFIVGCDGTADRYNDFRYDPNGNQVLNSVAGIEEARSRDQYAVFRDINSSIYNQDKLQYVIRKAGVYAHQWSYYVGCGADCYTDTQSSGQAYRDYKTNPYKFKDNTYSFAIGYNDKTEWMGVTPFAFPRMQTKTLQAPVIALSSKLRVDPQSVKSGYSLPRVSSPENVRINPTLTEVADNTKTIPVNLQKTLETPSGSLEIKEKDAKTATQLNITQILSSTAIKNENTVQDSKSKTSGVSAFSVETSESLDDGGGFDRPVYAFDVSAFSNQWRGEPSNTNDNLDNNKANADTVLNKIIDDDEAKKLLPGALQGLIGIGYVKFGQDGANKALEIGKKLLSTWILSMR